MKHYFVLTIIFASISISLAAQTTSLPSIQSQLDAMFAGLDKTKVPTGFLWDKAANIVEPEGYDGSALSDSNLVNLQVFHDILYSLNAASVGADTLDRTSILSSLESSSTSNSVAVGLLFQSYNFIVANALVDNLIVYSNGVVSDAYAGGSWRNPYGTGYLIACAPGTCEVELGTVSFTLSNIDSTPDISPGAIWFDCGDGYGYRSVSLGTPFNVTFTSPGIYELKFKVSYAGLEYVSHSAINVSATSILPMYNYVQDSVSAYYNGVRFKAMVSYNPDCTFMNPLIVSEGFDPWKMALKDASANRTHYYSGYTDIDSFLRFARSNITNKDIVYVDWYDCSADIRANAEVFKAVIRWVNARKPSNASPNTVLGQSMGGLIARYALCSMESSGERHRTTMFISHDVPYNGANISPGIMYGYWDMWSIMRWFLPIHNFFTINDWPEELLNIGEYTSVKQMLPLYLTRNYSYDNSEFAALQEDLSDMGFPKGDEGSTLENIAIINGGKTADGSISLYSTGDHLLDFQFYASTGVIPELLLALISYWLSNNDKGLLFIPGKTSIQWDYQLNPFLTNGCLVYKSTASIKKKWLWLLPSSWCIHDSEKYAPSTGPAYDAASGSVYDTTMLSISLPYWDKGSSSIWWGTFDTSLDIAEAIMFIPTASAFAMNSDYFRDFSSNPPMPGIETPFTSYIQSDTATRHIDFFYGIKSWLGTVSSTISGPLIAFQGDTYSISGATNSTTWTATESNIIGSNGTIQDSTHFGLLGLKATVNGQNSVCTKNKEILLGIPRVNLQYVNNNNSYTITANFIDEGVADFINDNSLLDSLSFSWSILKDNSFESLPGNGTSVTVNLNQTVASATVFLTISYRGRSSQSFIAIRWIEPYLKDIVHIYKYNGNMRCIYDALEFPLALYPASGKLILKENPDTWSPGIPYRLKMLGNYYLPTVVTYGGDDYYFFDLFNDMSFQTFFSGITESNSPQPLVIDIYNSQNDIVQTITYNISC